MKVSTILTIVVFLVALFGSIAGTSYYYVQINKVVTGQIYEHLESVVQSRGNHIETQLKMEKELAQNLALIGKVGNVLLDPSNTNILVAEERLQKTVSSIEQIQSIGVINKNNILIASTDSELVGYDYSETIFFKENSEKKEMIQFIDDPNLGIMLSVVSPVKDDAGNYLGMIVMEIDFENLNKITLDKTGIGETGEVYLINSEGYAITPLLFTEDAVLKWKIDTISSRNCLSALDNPIEIEQEHIGHEPIETFLDYIGEKVIGAHYYIPGVEWCLLAEINEKEILGEQRVLFQRAALIIIITLTIIITLIGFVVGKFIDKRVVLKKGKKKL